MQYTENFDLAMPDGTDYVDISVLNENMQKIADILDDIYGQLPIVVHFQDGEVMTDPVGAEVSAACGQLNYSLGFETGKLYHLKFELNGEVLGETDEVIEDYIYDGNTYKALYNSYIIDNAEVIGVIHNESTGMYEPMLQPANGKSAYWAPDQVVDGEIQNFVVTITKVTE